VPPAKTPTRNFRVLGCDPGRVNFGWAIYSDLGLEEYGSLEGAEDISRLDAVGSFFERLVKKKRPDCCCIERFHPRPGFGAVHNIEVVNLMIGQCRTICTFYRIPVILITASEHKSWLSRHFHVERLPVGKGKGGGKVTKKYDLGTYAEWVDIKSEHEVDAANVAKFCHDYKGLKLRSQEK
jgi:hypothetical protein